MTKKNSQQILKNDGTGRPFIAPSRAYREYAEAAGMVSADVSAGDHTAAGGGEGAVLYAHKA